MILTEFVALLRTTGLPVAFSHFDEKSYPGTPFITYLTTDDDALAADNKNYHKATDVTVELYTDTKDPETESLLETILDNAELPYDASQVYIESERLFQKIYEMRLI